MVSVMVLPPRLVQAALSELSAARWVSLKFQRGGRYGVAVLDAANLSLTPSLAAASMPLKAIPLRDGYVSTKATAALAVLLACKDVSVRSVDAEAVCVAARLRVRGKQSSVPLPSHAVHPERCCVAAASVGEAETSKTTTGGAYRDAVQIPFTFVELFCGIGGFRVGLEPLGGRCVFASELDPAAVALYRRNAGTAAEAMVSGDIRDVDLAAAVPPHDLLTAGFPCQPFSTLGDQPGLASVGGKGTLFECIVQVLTLRKPRAFLLENVPGLLTCDGGAAFATIVTALEGAGYAVTHELVNSRCLTAQARNRLYIVGILLRPAPWTSASTPPLVGAAAASAAAAAAAAAAVRVNVESDRDSGGRRRSPRSFAFPFIPDLKLRASDVLEDSAALRRGGVADSYTLNSAQWAQLQSAHAWRRRGPSSLAWPQSICRAIIAHYSIGTAARGASQLVPRDAPHNPRCFTARECARLMGFPASFSLRGEGEGGVEGVVDEKGDRYAEGEGVASDGRGGLYRMLGNAVCPPVIAAIGAAVLGHALSRSDAEAAAWDALGQSVSVGLARRATMT